jgi:hypothetical protein
MTSSWTIRPLSNLISGLLDLPPAATPDVPIISEGERGERGEIGERAREREERERASESERESERKREGGRQRG